MTDDWMHGIARSVLDGDAVAAQEIMRHVREQLDRQMAPETESPGTVGGSHRDESGGATGGDVTTKSGSGEPSGEAETLAE